MSGESPAEITLHSSWGSFLGPLAGAGILVVGGLYGALASDFAVVPVVLLALGVVGVLIVVFDMPVSATFHRDGVTRRTMLRRRTFPWVERCQLTRGRPGILPGSRRVRHGGLVLARPRSRVLLVTQSESLTEFDTLREIIADGDSPWVVELVPPPDESSPPTWLYRRSKWRPE